MARAARLVLPAGVLATVAILLAVFYYPVGSVLVAAVVRGGRLTLGPLATVLGDPFYTGVLSGAVSDPARVPAGLGGWVRAGFPSVEFGLFGFTAYQAALSTVASVAVGLPGAYILARYEFAGRRTLRSLTIVPFVLPSIMVAVGFLAMFGQNGLLNDILAVFGLGPVGGVLFTLKAVVSLTADEDAIVGAEGGAEFEVGGGYGELDDDAHGGFSTDMLDAVGSRAFRAK